MQMNSGRVSSCSVFEQMLNFGALTTFLRGYPKRTFKQNTLNVVSCVPRSFGGILKTYLRQIMQYGIYYFPNLRPVARCWLYENTR